ncbi:MAG: hypothetical protein NT098_06150, partial [Candidatus Parcubacteria bacterium]|nr:hypothetical protein [Candidatus Parcubacteria bacterium]
MLNINTSRTRMVTVAGIIIGVSWGAYAIAETIINSQIDEIPNVLKLKVSTEKILDSRIIRDIRNLSDGTIVDLGEISQYDYISNVEVPDEKNEILSERTHNSKSIALPNGKKEMRFYGGSPFRKVGEKWYQVESATTTISAYDLQMKKLSFIEKAFATDFYAPAGDGRVGYQTTTWSAAHNASNGNDADIGSWYDSILGDRKNEVGFFIYRSFFPFDTSAIGDDDRIESASIHFSFVQAATLPTSAVTTNYVIVTTTQASVTSLSNSDYSQIGGTSYGSFSILHSSADGTALSANLSSPDSLISKTGYTKLGAREYDHDFLNVEAVHNYGSAVYDSCQTGTDYDPYLSVVLAATPLASTLQVESQTNPGSISTTTPSFSVIHQNASSTEIATSYQLQITTNPQNFNTLFSDSGKTTLSSSTPPGMRTPQFYATSTFPLNGATYYYRIKLWEQSGLAGPFSTSTSYFTMVDNAYSGPTRQDISYTYDAVGNITNISDFTPTYGTSTVSYTYDQLYRLITASSSNTTVTNWSDSYTYSPIGNISSSTSKG